MNPMREEMASTGCRPPCLSRTWTAPLWGLISPARQRASVDLPLPGGPEMPVRYPRRALIEFTTSRHRGLPCAGLATCRPFTSRHQAEGMATAAGRGPCRMAGASQKGRNRRAGGHSAGSVTAAASRRCRGVSSKAANPRKASRSPGPAWPWTTMALPADRMKRPGACWMRTMQACTTAAIRPMRVRARARCRLVC